MAEPEVTEPEVLDPAIEDEERVLLSRSVETATAAPGEVRSLSRADRSR